MPLDKIDHGRKEFIAGRLSPKRTRHSNRSLHEVGPIVRVKGSLVALSMQ